MTLQTIAHYTFPASIRDIGTGIYHLAKKDATEEQCQKMVTGAIRVATAVLTALTAIAAIALLPAPLGELTALVVLIPMRFLDLETGTLLLGTIGIASGLASCASGIVHLARGLFAEGAWNLFAEGAWNLFAGTLFTGASWFVTRIPKDISFGFRGLFADKIDGLGDDWGSKLYEKTL